MPGRTLTFPLNNDTCSSTPLTVTELTVSASLVTSADGKVTPAKQSACHQVFFNGTEKYAPCPVQMNVKLPAGNTTLQRRAAGDGKSDGCDCTACFRLTDSDGKAAAGETFPWGGDSAVTDANGYIWVAVASAVARPRLGTEMRRRT